jgi:hypothetical protein
VGIRDEELSRMTSYANGLGIKVTFVRDQRRNKKSPDYAYWTSNPPEICIYVTKHNSKTQVILTFIHELAHHIYWIHNNKPEIPHAYVLEAERKKKDPFILKSERKKILEYERSGIDYMKTIAVELNLKIPLWKVEMAQEFDLWVYEYYYETGHFPVKNISDAKREEMKDKYQPKGSK